MTITEAVEEYRVAKAQLAGTTTDWYGFKLRPFAEWCEQEGITLETLRVTHFRRFLEAQRSRTNPQTGKPLSSYTIHGFAQVVKGFLSWCSQEEGLEDIVAETLPKRLSREMPKVEIKIIEIFTDEQLKRLDVVCERECSKTLEVRDRTILAFLLDTGLRAEELCELTLESLRLHPDESYVRVIYGAKGRKQRMVGIGRETRMLLRKYIERFRRAPQTERHVFLGRYNEPLTRSGLYQIIDRLGEWARIEGVRCSPHTFRHTFAVNYLLKGGDVFDLSRLMGHSSVKVTEIYLQTYRDILARRRISVRDTLGS